MCSASTMHRALIESNLKPSNWVVFPGGGGGVGIQGVQLAKYATYPLFREAAATCQRRAIELMR